MMKMKFGHLILILISCVMLTDGAWAKASSRHPKTRQPKKVARIQKMAFDPQVARLLSLADEKTEKLDQLGQDILKDAGLTPFQRWSQSERIERNKAEYSRCLQAHLALVADLFKVRHQKGRLPQYQEFEFQNLLRKSDYLLSLGFSRDSVEFAKKNKTFSDSFGKTLVAYNEQRFQYDRKTISTPL